MIHSSAVLAALALSLASSASAQRGLDRGLTMSRPSRPENTVAAPPLGGLLAVPVAEEPLTASWLIVPLSMVSGSDNEFGLLGGYKNIDRHGAWPWQVTLRGVRSNVGGAAHFRWQLDGEVYPSLGKLGTTLHLSPYLAANHSQTSGVSQSDLLTVELDYVFREDSVMTISLGGVGYYGWKNPDSGPPPTASLPAWRAFGIGAASGSSRNMTFPAILPAVRTATV
jgi:hypothetical protein